LGKTKRDLIITGKTALKRVLPTVFDHIDTFKIFYIKNNRRKSSAVVFIFRK